MFQAQKLIVETQVASIRFRVRLAPMSGGVAAFTFPQNQLAAISAWFREKDWRGWQAVPGAAPRKPLLAHAMRLFAEHIGHARDDT
jgi:hypothetical protein